MYNIKFVFLVGILLAVILYCMFSKGKDNLLYNSGVNLRDGEYNTVYKTGLVTRKKQITGMVPTDTSLYKARATDYLTSDDKKTIEPTYELLDNNPVHYLSTPTYKDFQRSMEDKVPLPVATSIRI